MSVQILFRRGTAAEWNTANPILGSGEPGFETDTGKIKIGNGESSWQNLEYISGTVSTLALEDLSNSNIVSPTNGQVLKYQDGVWTNGSDLTGGGVFSIDELADVIISEPVQGQILKYNGSSWVNGTDNAGGGALPSRSVLQGTSGTLTAGASGPINLSGYAAYTLLKITSSHAAWIRIYTSEAARQADSSRSQNEDPVPGSGIITEVITSGSESVLISPGAIGFNDESPVTTNIPIRVTNLSGGNADITVTLTAIQLEA